MRLKWQKYIPGLPRKRLVGSSCLGIAQLVEQLIVDVCNLSGTQLVTGSIPVPENLTQIALLAQ